MDYALELGHEVIAFTEHETVSNSVNIIEAYEARKRIILISKLFWVMRIYLTRNGLNAENFDAAKDKYFHFYSFSKKTKRGINKFVNYPHELDAFLYGTRYAACANILSRFRRNYQAKSRTCYF